MVLWIDEVDTGVVKPFVSELVLIVVVVVVVVAAVVKVMEMVVVVGDIVVLSVVLVEDLVKVVDVCMELAVDDSSVTEKTLKVTLTTPFLPLFTLNRWFT